MQKLYRLFSIISLAGLLIACVPSFQPTEVKTVEESAAVPSTASTDPYLNCLSPALKMNAERAAHTATLLPDGKVLIAGGFRDLLEIARQTLRTDMREILVTTMLDAEPDNRMRLPEPTIWPPNCPTAPVLGSRGQGPTPLPVGLDHHRHPGHE